MTQINSSFEGFEEIADSINLVAPEVLRELGAMGVQHLIDLDMSPDESGNAHPELASLWYATEPTDEGNQWSIEILSHAEDMTFFTPTTTPDGEREKTGKYPISGRQLLMILEGGARAHFIFPRNAKMLIFAEPGYAQRTTEFHKRYGFSYLSEHGSETVITDEVMHPGVKGNEHIDDTVEWMESIIDAWGEEAAGRIAVRAG